MAGKFVVLLFGLVVGAVGGMAGLIYLQSGRAEQDDNLVFAPKNFYDAKMDGELGAVFISGTLTGRGLAYPNNTYAISCYGRFKACFVSSVNQIGREQIGRMDNPADYPIVKWTAAEVVAREESGMFACRRVTLTIDRRQEQLLWLEEPVNQSKPSCKDADITVRKFSIEDSPLWKQILGK